MKLCPECINTDNVKFAAKSLQSHEFLRIMALIKLGNSCASMFFVCVHKEEKKCSCNDHRCYPFYCNREKKSIIGHIKLGINMMVLVMLN